MFVNGDDQRSVVPYFNANYSRGDGGRSRSWNVGPEIDYKMLGRFSSSFSLNYAHNMSDNQWYGNFTDSIGVTHYTFAHLNQTTTSATVRLNYTFTPNVSLQAYTQPFVSKGTYSNVRQLSATPRADAYDDRYAALRRHVGHEQSGRLQLQGIPVERRVPLGVQARIDALRRLERGAPGLPSDAGDARFHGRRQGPDAAAPGEHVPGEAVVLAESLSDRAAALV